MIGHTQSPHKVLEEISRGGKGIVYKALDLKLNREVALAAGYMGGKYHLGNETEEMQRYQRFRSRF